MKKYIILSRNSLFVLLLAAATASTGFAAVGEITVDSEVIPARLFVAYEKTQMFPNDRCTPISDAYVRDKVIDNWITLDDGRRNQLELLDYQVESIEDSKQEMLSLAGKASADHRDKYELYMLLTEASSYNSHTPSNVTDEEALALYKQSVLAKDSELFDVNVVRFNKVTFDKRFGEMEQFVETLNAGKSWEALMEPLDGFARNYSKSDQWHTIPDMDDYSNTTIQRMVGDGRQLNPGDVIGPLEMYAYAQIFRIEEQKVLPQIRFNEPLNGEDAWGMELMKKRLKKQHWRNVYAEQRRGRDIRENGEPVIVPAEYPTCDGY